ncbi:hypothetical protein K402DRAFT_419563 [Aulographum hederae CBS 113979]|uniref:Uncharacterized protein n=1 Tax=Aulographum hederae CBS 113979 TaxID=1176131 RepID=A0A6G1H571_9PEZI|nr:hypothetical protein K402DRAFT_419563 [Aulographum hederae CBS 113979]
MPPPKPKNDVDPPKPYSWEEQLREIDYYGVIFDHLVPEGEEDPETLQINIFEIEADGGEYAKTVMTAFNLDLEFFEGKRILAVPRCCQTRKGTTDRRRINGMVKWREEHPGHH